MKMRPRTSDLVVNVLRIRVVSSYQLVDPARCQRTRRSVTEYWKWSHLDAVDNDDHACVFKYHNFFNASETRLRVILPYFTDLIFSSHLFRIRHSFTVGIENTRLVCNDYSMTRRIHYHIVNNKVVAILAYFPLGFPYKLLLNPPAHLPSCRLRHDFHWSSLIQSTGSSCKLATHSVTANLWLNSCKDCQAKEYISTTCSVVARLVLTVINKRQRANSQE